MGKKHLESYLAIGAVSPVTLAGVVEQNREKGEELAALGNCPWYPDLEAAFKAVKPDFADICLPSNLHRDAVVFALERRADVIVEKPFAVELEDIDAMIAARDASGKRLMVAHTCRFMPQYHRAKEIIDSGEYGKLLNAVFFRESETPKWSWNNWLQNQKASGGTILDLSIHDIDLANWFFGVPESVNAYETSCAGQPGASQVTSVLAYSRGFATVLANHLMPQGYPFTAGYRLLFEKAALEWNTINCTAGKIFIFDGKENSIPVAPDDPYELELLSFVNCLKSGSPFAITVEEARLAVSTVKELCASIKKRAL
jgi:predicted dehydrogenase